MNLKTLIPDIIDALSKDEVAHDNFQVLIGLDGYVDKIQRVVKSQSGQGSEYYATIEDFATHIGQAAGKSAQIEVVTQETKLGGNAPIMAHALGCMGIKSFCIGNFGYPAVEEVFQQIHPQCTLISLGPPAETNALEFDDGKLILSEVTPFNPIDWAYVKQHIGLEQMTTLVKNSQMVALVDWCNLPYATSIWEGILEEVLPVIPAENRHFLFDLADPSKKAIPEIAAALEVIRKFAQFGQVTLGLNENEASKLARAICQIQGKAEAVQENVPEKCQLIYDYLSIDHLLVHPVDRSILVSMEGVCELPGRLVLKPRISTGGGDNLNAGFCYGQLMGMDVASSAILGMATSGAYVQNGASSDKAVLITYLKNWLAIL